VYVNWLYSAALSLSSMTAIETDWGQQLTMPAVRPMAPFLAAGMPCLLSSRNLATMSRITIEYKN
jgi:hypothetical protein